MAKYGVSKYGEDKYGPYFYKDLSVGVEFETSVKKDIDKPLSIGIDLSPVLSKKVNKPLSMNVEFTTSIKKTAKKILSATIDFSVSIGRAISKGLAVIIELGVTTKKSITRALKVLVEALVNAYKYWQVYPELSFTEYPIETEVYGMATAGSTITLKGKFPTSAGDLTQLTDVTLKIYAPSKVLLETIIPSETDTGVYMADYTIPETKYGQFDYEFSGKLGIRTITSRRSFDSHWRE